MIEITATGAGNLAKWLDATNARSKKALYTATRVEGFRLMRLLRQEIKQGAPGGRPFAPLSVIARSARGIHGDPTPLRRFALLVRYQADQDMVRIGFFSGRSKPLSQSWRRLTLDHQYGFYHDMKETTRKRVLRQLKYVEPGLKKYFALRKTTRRFYTPARPIIEPFWSTHEAEALRNIRSNFRRKLAGDRI